MDFRHGILTPTERRRDSTSPLRMSAPRWAAGLLCISAALLAYELLLMRLLALAYWGHFAGMVISIAMLGIAAAGLLLFFARARIKARPATFFAGGAGAFAVAAPLAFLLSQQLPFTPFLLTWSAGEYGLLAARSLLFFSAFLAAGFSIGVPFVARVAPVGRLYFWNMLGSGLPAFPLLWAMNFIHPMRLLIPVTALAIAVPLLSDGKRIRRVLWGALGVGVSALVLATPFRYSEYKELPKTLLLPEAKVVEERFGWDAVVQVVASPHTRYVPGLSLNFTGTLPRAQLVFTDATAMTLVFAPPEALAHPDFLRMTPEAFSFSLMPNARVLNFYGGSADLLRAEVFGARPARVVDDSTTRLAIVRQLLAEGGRADLTNSMIRADPRQLLAREPSPGIDVIAVSLLGTHGTSTAGAASLDASFLLTVEGFSRMFGRLSPAGHVAISTWVENPARSGVRLASLCVDTLHAHGVPQPARHLIAIRSWSSVSIFLSREPFEQPAIESLKVFCDENSFDLVWFPGIDPAETNRINVLPEGDPYFSAFAALLGPGRDAFIARFPFAIESPRDDRPFFNQSFRWAAVPQWISTMGVDWLPFVEWGYILHVATLLVVALLGGLLLIVPCFVSHVRPRLAGAVLFLSLGVAYMLVQIWAILKLSLFLGHPLLASALVLSAMLVASGTGAAVLTRGTAGRSRGTFASLLGALVLAIALFPILLRLAFPQPEWLRIITSIAWLVLPSFFMGFPFPNALARIANKSALPWALALNGFGSVLGALLATLLAVHFGLLALAGSAVVLYAIVALISLRHAAL